MKPFNRSKEYLISGLLSEDLQHAHVYLLYQITEANQQISFQYSPSLLVLQDKYSNVHLSH
jgi:hypothetical protein